MCAADCIPVCTGFQYGDFLDLVFEWGPSQCTAAMGGNTVYVLVLHVMIYVFVALLLIGKNNELS